MFQHSAAQRCAAGDPCVTTGLDAQGTCDNGFRLWATRPAPAKRAPDEQWMGTGARRAGNREPQSAALTAHDRGRAEQRSVTPAGGILPASSSVGHKEHRRSDGTAIWSGASGRFAGPQRREAIRHEIASEIRWGTTGLACSLGPTGTLVEQAGWSVKVRGYSGSMDPTPAPEDGYWTALVEVLRGILRRDPHQVTRDRQHVQARTSQPRSIDRRGARTRDAA